jgi:hypothetical protein
MMVKDSRTAEDGFHHLWATAHHLFRALIERTRDPLDRRDFTAVHEENKFEIRLCVRLTGGRQTLESVHSNSFYP